MTCIDGAGFDIDARHVAHRPVYILIETTSVVVDSRLIKAVSEWADQTWLAQLLAPLLLQENFLLHTSRRDTCCLQLTE